MNLADFQTKRISWIEALNGNDCSAIDKQLCFMLWNSAVFHSINEARRIAPISKGGEVKLNPAVHELINRGYFCDQLISIRRLIDGFSLNCPTKGVNSLKSLINDMRNSRSLFTREAILIAEGLAGTVADLHGEIQRERRNKCIDRLTGIEPNKRSNQDTVKIDVYENLSKRLDEKCGHLKTYCDKFLAHSATQTSRAAADADKIAVTLNCLIEAQRVLVETYSFISTELLGGNSFGGLATPQYDQFEYIERPLVKSEQIPDLQEAWDTYRRQVDSWSSWGMDEMQSENNSKTTSA